MRGFSFFLFLCVTVLAISANADVSNLRSPPTPKVSREERKARRLNHTAALGGKKTRALRKKKTTVAGLGMKKVGTKKAEAVDAVEARRLQDTPLLNIAKGVTEKVQTLPRDLGQIVLNFGQNGVGQLLGGTLANLTDGGIPSIGSVLEGLNFGRTVNNRITAGLSEVTSVFNILPRVLDQIDGMGVVGGGAQGGFSGNLFSSGIFGLNGLLGSIAGGGHVSGFFESSLFSRFGRLFGGNFGRIPSFGGFSSGVGSSVLKDAGTQQEAAEASLANSRQLGAEMDGLTTIFSGGLNIPLFGILEHLQKSLMALVLTPGNVALWETLVLALQQLKEDLLRLPLAWQLDGAQGGIVNEAVAAIDSLLTSIGSHSGLIDVSFFKEISLQFGTLGSTLLRLDGGRLTPRLDFHGFDLTNKLGNALMSFPLDLAQFSFLKESFGLSSRFLDTLLFAPVSLGRAGLEHLSNLARLDFIPEILFRTLGTVPAMLTQGLQIKPLLHGIRRGLFNSLDFTGNGVDAGASLSNLFQFPSESAVNDLFATDDKESIFAFIKLLRLDSATNALDQLLSGLQEQSKFVFDLLPLADLSKILNINNLSNLGSSILGSASSLVNGIGNDANLLTNLPGQLFNGVNQIATGLAGGLTGGLTGNLGSNIGTGINGLSDGLNGALDRIQTFVQGQRRLQETDSTTTADELSTSDESDFPNMDFDEMDIESVSLFSLASSVSFILDVVIDTVESVAELPCLTKEEVSGLEALRAETMKGNPVTAMGLTGASDAEIAEVLGTEEAAPLAASFVGSVDPLCEQKKDALSILQKWAENIKPIFESVTIESLGPNVDMIENQLENLISNECNLPTPPV